MSKELITILCSGVALGVYVPGLLLRDRLIEQNISTEIEIIEKLYHELTLEKLGNAKLQFHKNLRMAIKGHQVPQNMTNSILEEKKEQLFDKWASEGRRRFVVFSGFWVNILDEYCKTNPLLDCHVDCIHMDSTVSSSWSVCSDIPIYFNRIWPFSYEGLKVSYAINSITKDMPKFSEREDALVVHGGGWGMGTFASKPEELIARKIPCHFVHYYADEINPSTNTFKGLYLDEKWFPWSVSNNGYTYPNIMKVDGKGNLSHYDSNYKHKIYQAILSSKAILSKPGGATLLDSLETETPLIFLEPVGSYEKYNAKLWVELGFGIHYDTWEDNGFSFEIFDEMHERIHAYKQTIKGVEEDLCSLKQM